MGIGVTAPSDPPAAGEQTQLLVALARIETKLDSVTTGHTDHETRIRVLERKVWAAAGVAGALAAGGSAAISKLFGA